VAGIERLAESLSVMGLGMLGIFVVMALIYAITFAVSWASGKK